MAVTSTDFLDSAKAMLADGTNIGRRNAVSRSYYAAYHDGLRVADQYCPDSNHNFKMGTHERLIEQFKGCTSIQRGRSLGIILQSLKVLRHQADYHLNKDMSEMQAVTHIKTAELFLNELAGLAETSSDSATG